MTGGDLDRDRRISMFNGGNRIGFSWLDFRLGFRMLGRYPGLTIVGGLAMAFAIWVGATTFEFINQVVSPNMPLRGGDRVVTIRLWNAEQSQEENNTPYDFQLWRRDLRSFEELGAYRVRRSNLAIGGTFGEPVDLVEISPSAFRLAPEPPLFGRALVAADTAPDAPPVMVLGHDLWQLRFAADSTVVGRVVRMGGVATTIVGVMPPGWEFPNVEQAWTALRLSAVAAPGEGPPLLLYARLREGATSEQAEAEVNTAIRRTALASPLTHQHLRARVHPFSQSVINMSKAEGNIIRAINLFLVMLLVLVCGNVALLMFARAATRETEIVVRSALGASRRRIIGQFFAEALVLGALALAVGLIGTGAGLRWWIGAFESAEGPLPFWFTSNVSVQTTAYAVLLTIIGAAIAGVLPAAKITRGLGHRLRERTGGGGGPKIGGIWTVVIVAQIAVTVAFPVSTLLVRRDMVQITGLDVGFDDAEYLTSRLVMDPVEPGQGTTGNSSGTDTTRFRIAQQRLMARLAAEPAVAGVTFGERLPRMYHPHRLVEVDSGGTAPLHPSWPAYRVSSAHVGLDYFDVLGAPVTGRPFVTGDRQVAIVNESFVRVVLGGRNPLGRRIRYTYFEEQPSAEDGAPPGPWFEIVGVVKDLGMAPYSRHDPKSAGIYHPAAIGSLHPVRMAVHVKGDPQAFKSRLRELGEGIDPALRVDNVQLISEVALDDVRFYTFWMRLTGIVSLIALTLSLAGIYAVMSFTVARRTREIGVRIALGADRKRLVFGVFRKPLTQVAIGVLTGTAIVTLLTTAAAALSFSPVQIVLLASYSLLMLGICLLACVVPTRRALGIEPTEALRADA
jgi:putative ABC transport system permease protein